MKNIVILLLLGTSFYLNAQCGSPTIVEVKGLKNHTRKIDVLDSVFFDLTKSVLLAGNYVDIPVSIKSDDTINALDFEMKYNHTNLLYDSIYDYTGHIQMSEYYNPNDSTIRFTSNSLTNYAKNVKLVTMRFKMLSLTMNKNDFNSIKVYLNGDLCSYAFIGNVIGIGVGEIGENLNFNFYPNPATENIFVNVSETAKVQIIDVAGKQISPEIELNMSENNVINIQEYSNGIYFLKVSTQNATVYKKVMINK